MAKGKGQRPLPSTPGSTPGPRDPGSAPDAHVADAPAPGTSHSPGRATPKADDGADRVRSGYEPYVIAGTGCLAGHDRGHELQAGPIGTLPTRRTAWIGFGLVLWCGIGLAFILDPQWLGIGVLVLVAWLLFSAVVQRRLGHRGKCWRTRAWRQAWGGLVPGRD